MRHDDVNLKRGWTDVQQESRVSEWLRSHRDEAQASEWTPKQGRGCGSGVREAGRIGASCNVMGGW